MKNRTTSTKIFAPWNTNSTEVELFSRSAIPLGEALFIRFPRYKFEENFAILVKILMIWFALC